MSFPVAKSGRVAKLNDPTPQSLRGRLQDFMEERHNEKAPVQQMDAPRPDVEKGVTRPTVARLQIPSSSFDMDSPGSDKISTWSKIFGRK
jgi:hypothetical protein